MTEDGEQSFRLDVMVAASGFKNKDQQELEQVSVIRLIQLRQICNIALLVYAWDS